MMELRNEDLFKFVKDLIIRMNYEIVEREITLDTIYKMKGILVNEVGLTDEQEILRSDFLIMIDKFVGCK